MCKHLRREEDEHPERLGRFQWRYKYESPSKTWKHEVQLLALPLGNTTGDFWVTPPDGRIFLSLTPKPLFLRRGEIGKAESKRLLQLIGYSNELLQCSSELKLLIWIPRTIV